MQHLPIGPLLTFSTYLREFKLKTIGLMMKLQCNLYVCFVPEHSMRSQRSSIPFALSFRSIVYYYLRSFSVKAKKVCYF